MDYNRLYCLDEHGDPYAEVNPAVWAEWYENAKRHIAEDDIDGVRVSTVFLGIDHSFGESGPPILFETMIFGGKLDQYQVRSATKHAALSDHDEAVMMVRDSQRSWLQRLWNWIGGA